MNEVKNNIGFLKPILNLILRGFTMACKFLLVIVLAKILSPAQVGLFGLFSATLLYSQLLIGGEFYAYSQRELISAEKKKYSFVLQHQLISLFFLYIFFIPILFGIFIFDLLPIYIIKWFFFILVAESIAQELNRILIALEYQLSASIILFLRQGLWVLIIVPVMLFNPKFQLLEYVFLSWLFGSIFALIFGFFLLSRIIMHWQFWPINFSWIIAGLKVSFLFFIGALCFRGLMTIDRYAVESLMGMDFLGAYIVYIGIAMSLVTVLDPLIFSFLYPKLVSSVSRGNFMGFKQTMGTLLKYTIMISSLGLVLLLLISPYIFSWLNVAIYSENIKVFWILLLTSFAYGMSMVPHFGLYALKKDRALMQIHLFSFIIFLLCLLILPSMVNLSQVAGTSLLIGFVMMGVLKTFFLIKYIKKS